jgi:hypothetical protein
MAPISREETSLGLGETGASAPRVPGIPAFSANGSGSVTITAPDSSGNDAVVTYSLRVMHNTGGGYTLKGYVQADGTVAAGEVFRTLTAWTATIAVTGLTDFIPYTFASRAQNELAVNSSWCSESAVMNTLPDIDYGLESASIAREVTGGNVKIDETTGVVVSSSSGTAVEATNNETWFYGNVLLTYKLLSYESDAATLEGQFSEDGGLNWSTATLSGGDGKTALTSSPTGVSHTILWDSYTDAGTSEYQTDMKLRLRAQDAEGDWGPYETTAEFTIYNRPAVATVVNSDSRTWDEDTTPVFQSIIPSLRGGTFGFPEIYIYASDGTTLVSGYPKKAVESIAGWNYETAPATWVALTPAGIPTASIDGVNRVRYTVQTALAAGDYLASFRLGELRDLS